MVNLDFYGMHVSVWSSLVVVALLRFRIYEDGVRVLWFLRPSVVVVVVAAGVSEVVR